MASLGYLQSIPKVTQPGWVYALFCESDTGMGYVKIGHSINPFGRLSSLAGSAPFTALYCGLVRTRDAMTAAKAEESIHRAFAHRRTNGEWFRFDFKSEDDKAEFKKAVPKSREGWTFFPYEAMREMNRRQALKALGTIRRMSPKGGSPISSKKARQELKTYGFQRV